MTVVIMIMVMKCWYHYSLDQIILDPLFIMSVLSVSLTSMLLKSRDKNPHNPAALLLLIQTHTNWRDWNFVCYPELHKYSFIQLCIQITQLSPKKQFQNWCFVEPFSIFSRRIESEAATEMVIRSWPRMLPQTWEIPFNSHCDVT